MDDNSIRVIHHLARSGGTLISKCIASMPDVVLLSEINPAGVGIFNPLQQAHQWYGLLNEEDIRQLSGRNIPFPEGISLIHERCRERGKTLVLRDWTHLDFIAVPFLEHPTYRLSLAEAVSQVAPVINAATVRHPVYQWLSLMKLPVMRGQLSLANYLCGCRHFAEQSVAVGFTRYEDFTRDPEIGLEDLCARLGIRYDPVWRERWWSCQTITGDAGGGSEIRQTSCAPVDGSLLDQFNASADYHRSLELLGYQHPEPR